ncbi:hypothetical protein GCM10022419_082840 [Nonomuraea rosea]|uniref:Uncharacterized protein n=1 Tax=Nonomuraea rosea TaxID=638574 RepID=A0ABP6YQ22_9ACTN
MAPFCALDPEPEIDAEIGGLSLTSSRVSSTALPKPMTQAAKVRATTKAAVHVTLATRQAYEAIIQRKFTIRQTPGPCPQPLGP